MLFFVIVTIVAIMAGFCTGLLGIGGGLIIFPAFLFILPLLGFEALPLNDITGISTVQIVIASFFSFIAHRKGNLIGKRNLFSIALVAGFGSITGAVLSAFIQEKALLLMYLLILIVAFTSMTKIKLDDINTKGDINTKPVNFLCFLSGCLVGALGLGGAVLYIPIMRYFYRLPTKDCVGNVTFIIFFASMMTFTGKAFTHQIPYELVVYTIVGAYIGTKIGAIVNKKLSSSTLKKILLTIIVLTAIRVFVSIIG